MGGGGNIGIIIGNYYILIGYRFGLYGGSTGIMEKWKLLYYNRVYIRVIAGFYGDSGK